MDAVFAILVLGAVISFGALISAGNERQRKALDGIREQAAQWATQDLRLKREKLACDVKVDDPVAWLNRVVIKAYGEDLGLTIVDIFDTPKALVCMAKNGRRVVFSPISPDDVHSLKKSQQGKLTPVAEFHPLAKLPRKVEHLKLSILNAGLLFDLELPLVWRLIGGNVPIESELLWMYL